MRTNVSAVVKGSTTGGIVCTIYWSIVKGGATGGIHTRIAPSSTGYADNEVGGPITTENGTFEFDPA
jgi:hypothetical protein